MAQLSQLTALNKIRRVKKPQSILTLLPLISPPGIFIQIDNRVLQTEILFSIQMALHSCSLKTVPEHAHLSALQNALNQIIDNGSDQLDFEIIDRLQEAVDAINLIKKLAVSRKAQLPTVRKGPSLKIPSHPPMILAVRHPSPSQNQMEGGQSHHVHLPAQVLLQNARSCPNQQQNLQTSSVMGKRKNTQIQSFNGVVASANIRVVPPMQLLSARDNDCNESSSRIITQGCHLGKLEIRSAVVVREGAGAADRVTVNAAEGRSRVQYFGLKERESQVNEEVAPSLAELDDTVRESKSFVEEEGLAVKYGQRRKSGEQIGSQVEVVCDIDGYDEDNCVALKVEVDGCSHRQEVAGANQGQALGNLKSDDQESSLLTISQNHRSLESKQCSTKKQQLLLVPAQHQNDRVNLSGSLNPKQSTRTRFQKVLSDINLHNKSSLRDEHSKPKKSSLSNSKKHLNAANSQRQSSSGALNQSNSRPFQKQRVQNSLIGHGKHSSSVLSNDKMPSSPQSINVFNNNIAKNIHQLGQRMQQKKRSQPQFINKNNK